MGSGQPGRDQRAVERAIRAGAMEEAGDRQPQRQPEHTTSRRHRNHLPTTSATSSPTGSLTDDKSFAASTLAAGDTSVADSQSPLVRVDSSSGSSSRVLPGRTASVPVAGPPAPAAKAASDSHADGDTHRTIEQPAGRPARPPFASASSSSTATSNTPSAQPPSNSAPSYTTLPVLASTMQAGPSDPETYKDQKDIPSHTIEISAAPGENQPKDQQHSSARTRRFKLPFGKQGKRRRRLFQEPITTITSSVGRKRNTNTTAGATTTSSAAGLLAVPGTTGRSRSLQDDGTGNSLSEFTSKTSNGSPPHSPAIDAETGINDVRGTNGILKRVHDSWSLIGLTIANIGPVAGAFFGVHTAKEYGGYSMLAIGWPLSGLCMCLFSAVLAELSSSYPVAGAMFTWTFRTCRLSPALRPFARYLSWICGSLLLCGHILAQMLLEFQIATVLQGLIVIFAEDYEPSTWRTILLAWACLLVSACLAANRFGRSPWLWKGVSLLVAATVLILVVSLFACTSYRNSPSFIFTSYRNETGWTSKGYVYLLGWVLTSIATGQDVAAHLAEEAKYPTKSVPMGVFWGTAFSYLIGWIVMLCIMAVTPEIPHGPTPTRDYGAPAQMLTEILPRPLAFVILLLIVILMIFQDTAQLLASSRFMWALARDSAIPFSPYLRRLSAGSQLPIRATWTVCAIAAPCLLLIAGSRQIVTSLILSGCGSSLVLAYLMPVICYLSCSNDALDIDGRNAWTLRGATKYVAAFGSCYVLLIIVMMCCPNFYPVTSTSFSYAAPVLAFVLLLSSLTWIFYGNSHYAGPIKSITVYTIGREVELPKLGPSLSTNRHTPNSGRPSDLQGLRGFSGPSATTGVEIGKTANLFSDSLPTVDLGRPLETVDISSGLVTRSWRSNELEGTPEGVGVAATDTQMTDYTEYSTEGSYTDSEGESDSDSETGGTRNDRTPARGEQGVAS